MIRKAPAALRKAFAGSEREILQEMYDDSLDVDDIIPAEGFGLDEAESAPGEPSLTE